MKKEVGIRRLGWTQQRILAQRWWQSLYGSVCVLHRLSNGLTGRRIVLIWYKGNVTFDRFVSRLEVDISCPRE